MKTRLLAGALIAFGAPILASAQCPAGTSPATFLVGRTYAFRLVSAVAPVPGRIAAIGTFTAFQGGYLNVTATVVDTSGFQLNTVNRLAPFSGRWMINSDCTGGMILLMLNREQFQLDITRISTVDVTTIALPGTLPADLVGVPVVTPAGTLSLSGIDNAISTQPVPVQASTVIGCVGPTGTVGVPIVPTPVPPSCSTITGPVPFLPPTNPNGLTGSAQPNAPTSCPVGLGNPNNLIKGSRWPYSLTGGGWTDTGTFVPSFLNPFAYSGDLTIENRTVNNGVVTPQPPVTTAPRNTGNPLPNEGINMPFMPNYVTQGRYIIYSDCSGGEFLFMANGFAVQLEFVFSKPDFSQAFVLRDDLAFGPQAQLQWGIFNRLP